MFWRAFSCANAFVRFAVIRRTKFVSFSAVITFLTSSAAPTTAPADIGIAARYPGDKNIGNDPTVILADDFESYTSTAELTNKWKVYGAVRMNIATTQHFAGAKSIEMTLPISTAEESSGLNKLLTPGYNTLFHRAYMKWDPGYNLNTSNHNGICMKGGKNPMTGQAPTGYDFFVLLVQNNDLRNEGPPGWLHNYAYTPYQDQQWGDHWYPTPNPSPLAASKCK